MPTGEQKSNLSIMPLIPDRLDLNFPQDPPDLGMRPMMLSDDVFANAYLETGQKVDGVSFDLTCTKTLHAYEQYENGVKMGVQADKERRDVSGQPVTIGLCLVLMSAAQKTAAASTNVSQISRQRHTCSTFSSGSHSSTYTRSTGSSSRSALFQQSPTQTILTSSTGRGARNTRRSTSGCSAYAITKYAGYRYTQWSTSRVANVSTRWSTRYTWAETVQPETWTRGLDTEVVYSWRNG